MEHIVILLFKLTGGMAAAGYAMLRKLSACGRIYWIAYLLGAGGCGFNMEHMLHSRFFNHVLHNIFCHWAAANITVADKEQFYHNLHYPP